MFTAVRKWDGEKSRYLTSGEYVQVLLMVPIAWFLKRYFIFALFLKIIWGLNR